MCLDIWAWARQVLRREYNETHCGSMMMEVEDEAKCSVFFLAEIKIHIFLIIRQEIKQLGRISENESFIFAQCFMSRRPFGTKPSPQQINLTTHFTANKFCVIVNLRSLRSYKPSLPRYSILPFLPLPFRSEQHCYLQSQVKRPFLIRCCRRVLMIDSVYS